MPECQAGMGVLQIYATCALPMWIQNRRRLVNLDVAVKLVRDESTIGNVLLSLT